MIRQRKVFTSNRNQYVRLPADLHFLDNVKTVTIRENDKERIVTSAKNTWDSFFLSEQSVTDDFLSERPEQVTYEREPFDD
ncbi:type II toxin-antitoxin system VapB family antitoxin [Xenorhabdus sp. PR6a]|uniref:type II toxin-antitoxin system VapB family antitoxin n=1 Tax=Xenorhabdus sp. PR6a TaxID=3025877 RepID=UPI002359FA26|nr:type II toxin-antitoxin system VapB family antitoxin [Xenorhabdus sp. PR6a]MDC9581887.1 type II toxin-antitoxin system VapB family antitoxin [Xenorhabdus sp. PR6a]